jgi:hypothetical protein
LRRPKAADQSHRLTHSSILGKNKEVIRHSEKGEGFDMCPEPRRAHATSSSPALSSASTGKTKKRAGRYPRYMNGARSAFACNLQRPA